jgi:hypothetical protein
MTAPDIDGRVPALQLLLADADDYEKKQLIAKAFGNKCVPRTDAEAIRTLLSGVRVLLEVGELNRGAKRRALNDVRVALGIIALNV